jgi:L-amino acid N-acyltransferase
MEVRRASEEDVPSMVEIENHEILEGTAHFGTEPISLADGRSRFDNESEHYPLWVALEEGRVIGFARSGPWKTREAYRFTTEIGVYVRHSHQGRGVAKAIYGEFLPSLKDAGFKTVVAGIALPNPASIKLHERFGLTRVGTLPKVGYKFDQWLDVGYWALTF